MGLTLKIIKHFFYVLFFFMEEGCTIGHFSNPDLFICLQTVLDSQGRTTRDTDNNTTRPAITQLRSARSLLFAVVHRTSHVPLDCLTAQNGPGR